MGIREENKRMTKLRIIESTRKLFFENGFVRISTKDISELSGVAQGSIFLHFGTKDQLLHEVIQEDIKLLQSELNEIDTNVTKDLFLNSFLLVIEHFEHILSRSYKDQAYFSDSILKSIENVELTLKNKIFDHLRNHPGIQISIVDSFIRIDAFLAMIKVNLIDHKGYSEYSSVIRQKKGKLVKLYKSLFDY